MNAPFPLLALWGNKNKDVLDSEILTPRHRERHSLGVNHTNVKADSDSDWAPRTFLLFKIMIISGLFSDSDPLPLSAGIICTGAHLIMRSLLGASYQLFPLYPQERGEIWVVPLSLPSPFILFTAVSSSHTVSPSLSGSLIDFVPFKVQDRFTRLGEIKRATF